MKDRSHPRHYVTVFGSSQASPDGPLYREAYELGKGLAQSGFGVTSGGYGGTMEAVSRGAREAGAYPVGITVATFDKWARRANAWVASEQKAGTYLERVAQLTERASAFVALRGGIGTLSEVSLVWSLLQIGELSSKPVVLLGECWKRYLQVVREEFMIRPGEIPLMHLAENVPQTLEFLRSSLK